MTIEDKLRDAFRADGETVRPEAIRPLGASSARHARNGGGQPFSLRRRFAIPLMAATAAAVIALGASVLVPTFLADHAGRSRPGAAGNAAGTGMRTSGFPAPAHSLAAGYSSGRLPAGPMPRYFVGIAYPPHNPATEYAFTVAVYSSATGKIVARLSPPQPGRYFQAVAALGDSDTFVAAATPGFPRPGDCRTWLYEFRLTPDGTPTGLMPLAVPELSGWAGQSSLATSANGSLVSYSTSGCTRTGGGSTGPYVLGEINLGTGKIRTWPNPMTTPAARGGAPAKDADSIGGQPSLSDGSLFSFVRGGNETAMSAWLARLSEPTVQVRQVLTAPGTSGVLAATMSPDARVMFALTVGKPTYPYTIRLGAYDTATGQLLRTWRVATHQGLGGELMTADESGGYLLVAGFPETPAATNKITIVSVATGWVTTFSLNQAGMPLDIAW